MERMEALSKHLGIELEEGETLEDYITEDSYTENSFDAEGGTYLVLTDEEADAAAAENVSEFLWAFNASFLAEETDLPEEVFAALQDKCEGANETFRKLVDATCGLDHIVSEAVSSDGRAHFMNTYDGHEWQEGAYYIYRTN